jgi:hypothetical protein
MKLKKATQIIQRLTRILDDFDSIFFIYCPFPFSFLLLAGYKNHEG